MNFISTTDLIAGQVFSEPVYSDGKNMLVPANVPLRQKDIDLLLSWGIDIVKTDGTVLDDVNEKIDEQYEEDAIIDFERENATLSEKVMLSEKAMPPPEKKEPSIFTLSDVQQNTGPYRSYRNLIDKLDALFTSLKSGLAVEMRMVENIGAKLLLDLRTYPDSFLDFILGGEISGSELAKSSVNTAILSAMAAQELKLPNHKISNIVTGALIHDIGMFRLSKGITEKKGALTEAELEQIKSHPLHSSKIATKELFGSREVNQIVLQHHERWDGQGYPDKIAGETIDIGARIVSVADAFEAMVSKKSYRNSLTGYQAIKNLLADNGRRFDPAVIIAFTKIMGIYPIGSMVRLNDNSVARVVNVHSNAPMRPVVQLLMNGEGEILGSNSAVVDLLADKTLFIKQAVDVTEFAHLNN